MTLDEKVAEGKKNTQFDSQSSIAMFFSTKDLVRNRY